MNGKRKSALLAYCVYTALGAAGTASAQQTTTAMPASSGGALEEIVVTANKREEKIDKVGLTISAISAQTLQEQHITSLQDVAAAVPGLSFSPTTTNTPIFTLRGIGYNGNSLGAYPAVTVYMDQAPLPFPVMTSHSAFDLQRIEVLKGPQGTLFGENSTGGAINYIAAKPTDHFEAGGDISYGNFNSAEENLYVGGPLSSTLSARLAINAFNQDGWQSSYTGHGTNGESSYQAGRLIVNWTASDIVNLSLNLNGWVDKSQPPGPAVRRDGPGGAGHHTTATAGVPLSPGQCARRGLGSGPPPRRSRLLPGRIARGHQSAGQHRSYVLDDL